MKLSRSSFLLFVLCLGVLPAWALAPLSAVHQRIRDVIVEQILDGQTTDVRIVATPVEFENRTHDEFLWSGGEATIPSGARWFALADRNPGIMGYHPVEHVFLDGDLQIIETRREIFYPRFYRDGLRRDLVELLHYRARPGFIPADRKPARSPSTKAGTDGDFTYNEFYGVIIEGDVPSGSSYSEFWSDPVQMFRTLLEYGYTADHIHVLYGEGNDETNFECDYYREQMVDFPAYKQDVRDLFTWMKDGNAEHGIPQVTSEDFIFLFTFDHGGNSGGCDSTLCLMDGCMPDTEFASYFNPIAYKHRAVDMQQCHSGGFIDNLENDRTVISTAASCSESAWEANEEDDCGGGVSVNYGEWNYWWISAMRSHLPWPGEEPVDADTNANGTVSFLEAHNYAVANDDRSEHPQWSDLGGIGDEIGLQANWGGAHLVHVAHGVDDASGGNGDGIADAGESIVMAVTLENTGNDDALGVSGTLRTDNPWVTIEDAAADYPDIPVGAQGQSYPDHYTWNSEEGTPDNTVVSFQLDWTAGSGAYSGTAVFNETVVKVILAVQQTSVEDSEGGNGNGIADPGEAIRLAVTLRNKGHAAARGVHGVLSTQSPYAVVTDDQADFPDIPGQSSGRSLPPHFGMEIAPDTPEKTWIDCTLDVTAEDGYTFSLPLRFMVGSRGTVLLVEDGDGDDAEMLEQMVGELGFGVDREPAADTDPGTWQSYSVLLWCAGGYYDPVNDSAWQENLRQFVADGGRLLIEGGELGYDHRYHEDFRVDVLHMKSWSAHGGGDLSVADAVHPLATVPNTLDETIAQDAPDNSQRDAVIPLDDAEAVLEWTDRPGKGSVVAFDDDGLEGNGGQIVVLYTDSETIADDDGQRRSLIDNSLEWLIGNDLPYLVIGSWSIDDSEFGNGDGIIDPGETLRLLVELGNHGSGEASGTWGRAWSDHEADVTFLDNFADWPAIPSGGQMVSDAPHLLLKVDQDTPCGTKVEVTLELTTDEGFTAFRSLSFKVGTGGGQHLTYAMTDASQIPNPGILDSPIDVTDAFRTADVNCYVRIHHSSTATIKVVLQDPAGKKVILTDHDDYGGVIDTTFDSQTQPHGPGSMSDYDGDVPTGTWHLYVDDLTSDMLAGVLDEWSLIFDTNDLCHGLTCDEPAADAVGNTMLVERIEGEDIRLSWDSVGGAVRYNVWRSKRADMGSEETVGSTVETTYDETGLPRLAPCYFYQVRSENSCHEETP